MNRRQLLTLAPALPLLATMPALADPIKALDWANRARYAAANDRDRSLPPDKRRVVFIGASVTENWARPEFGGSFLADHGFIGRGIGGQTTAQALLRFAPDVLALQPRAVHILVGTNDVAENAGPYDPGFSHDNLAAMATLARAAGIKVFLASITPSREIYWHKAVGNPTERIRALNAWIAEYCRQQGHTYIDYWPALADKDGGLKPELGLDSVHPNAAGYQAMAPIALKYLSLI